MKIAILGGLGIEHKSFYSNDVMSKRMSMGGAGWLCALTARALLHEPTIFSRIGDDAEGQCIRKILTKNSIQFRGSIKGKSQYFYSSLVNGDSNSYLAQGVNPQLEDIKPYIREMCANNILILSYNDSSIINYFCTHKVSHNIYKVANLSGSIIDYVHKFGINALKGFQLVTLNDDELLQLSKLCNCLKIDIIKILAQNNERIFVTSKSRATYSAGTETLLYNFDILPSVVDTIGAGDAFATTLSTMLYNSACIDESVRKTVCCAKKMCMLNNKASISSGEWICEQ